jgi:hypothetical protein
MSRKINALKECIMHHLFPFRITDFGGNKCDASIGTIKQVVLTILVIHIVHIVIAVDLGLFLRVVVRHGIG